MDPPTGRNPERNAKRMKNSAAGLFGLNGIDEETQRLVLEEFKQGELMNLIEAEKERRMIAEANKAPVYWHDGWRVRARVSKRILNQWILREGPDVWSDSFHQNYFRKHFPECFPKQISPKIQVGYTGGGKRETIRYGEDGGRKTENGE